MPNAFALCSQRASMVSFPWIASDVGGMDSSNRGVEVI